MIIPTPLFLADYKKLIKKFPSLRKEINTFEKYIQNPENELLGASVPGIKRLKGNKVFKYRPNKSANRGRSGGFRIIYYYVTTEGIIYPLTIYSKTEIEDIPSHIIDDIIRNYF